MKFLHLKIAATQQFVEVNAFPTPAVSKYKEMAKLFKNESINSWIASFADLTQPDNIELFTGSAEDVLKLQQECLQDKELYLLDQKTNPGSFLHRSKPSDVARVPDKTFICTPDREEAGYTNYWMTPEEGYALTSKIAKDSMKGRTLYVLPYHKGPLGSTEWGTGIQLTDSRYVVLNIKIMNETGLEVIELLDKGSKFTHAQHAKVDLKLEDLRVTHYPHDRAIRSVNSGYGGNAILPKKCDALRIDSYNGLLNGFYAEHMALIEIMAPSGKKYYGGAALPSACGKTNFAMIQPPKTKEYEGYTVKTIGDDLARIAPNKNTGRLHAVNPEKGYFGVAPGTSMKSNPNMMKTISKNTYFTNVMSYLNEEGGMEVTWEGKEDVMPFEGIAWNDVPVRLMYRDKEGNKREIPDNLSDRRMLPVEIEEGGKKWEAFFVNKETGEPQLGAHPNSRFTAPSIQCPILSDSFSDPEGVPLDFIMFGARRSNLTPLIYQAFNHRHGVFIGSSLFSEMTAAVAGQVGKLRWDPMAMIDFIGYNVGDYFKHWLNMPNLAKNLPDIYMINVFRKDENGKFLYPGFSWNFALIKWAIDRREGKVDARKTVLGNMPHYKDLAWQGLGFSEDNYNALFDIQKKPWEEELGRIYADYLKVGSRMPEELFEELADIRRRFWALK